MRINHNISAMITQGSLFSVDQNMQKSLEKLSTGLRINRSSDDAAGLGVSENLRTQVRGLKQSMRNIEDSISMLNIADGALQEQAEILQRMREIIIQAKNDTYTATERGYMYQEFNGLMNELDRIAEVTNYNGMQLFATPEAAGLDSNRLYDGTLNLQNGYDNNGFKSNHGVNNAVNIWQDAEDSVLGADDVSSANHFNMMVGANYDSEDSTAYDSATQSFAKNGAAANFITIQFGQMDAHSILTIYPAGTGGPSTPGDAHELWDDFKFDPMTDPEDMGMDAFGAASNVNEKLNVLLQIIDGNGEDIPGAWKSAFDNPNGVANVTGLERVNRVRANIGAWINRMEHALNNTINQQTQQQAAESQIRDVDFASETVEFTKNRILKSASTAMLAQANMRSQAVLQLI